MEGGARIPAFDLGFIEEKIPIFGLWCGPGYSAGQRGTSFDLSFTKVAEVPDGNGNFVDSKLDLLCQNHDRSYLLASGLSNEASLKAEADAVFLREITQAYESLTPSEKPYALQAFAAFAVKSIVVNVPSVVTSYIGNGISNAASFLQKNTSRTDPFVLLSGEAESHSILVDTDGNIVLEYSNNQEATTIKIDSELEKIDLIKQYLDPSSEGQREMKIQMNLESSVSELTYSTDGVIDLKGVIMGPLTQEKLDQFSKLGSLALDLASLQEVSSSDTESNNATSWQLFDSFDISLDPYALDEFDTWFDTLDPILIEPYQWERVDSSLENFWYYGNDQSLAAYDLGSVIQEVNWRPDFWADDWEQPIIDPWFSYAGPEAYDYFPEPVYYAAPYGGTSDYGSSYSWGTDFSYYGSSGFSSQSDFFFSYIDPLVLKLGGGAVHTTNLSGSKVRFDMDGDGDRDKTGWISADHGFLVIDKNKNGKIDNVSEMFSEQMSARASTGFAALAELDNKRNGRIDKNDKAFADLRLWTDINANGVTDTGELHKLGRFGIQSIDLNRIEERNQYDNGNMVLSTTSYTGVRKGISYTGEVAEVLFNFGDHAPVAHVYLSDQATALRTADGKVIEVLKDAGAQKVNASLSGVNVLIGGAGDVLNAGNAGQSLLIGNGGATLNGNDGSVHFIVNGSQNVVNTGTGTSFIEVHGDANTINASKGEVDIEVDGSRNKISIGSYAKVDLGGTANTLTAVAKSKDSEITVSGGGHTIHASNADISIEADASVTLNGKNNDISMAGDATLAGNASGGTLTVAGDNNKATLTGAFIAVTEGAELNLTGAKHQVVLAGDAELVMTSTGKGTTISVFGEDNQLTVSAATITLDEGAGLELTGTGSKITLTGDARLETQGYGHVIEVYGTGNALDVDRSKVYEHAFADMELIGVGNMVKVTSDYSPAVTTETKVLAGTERALQQAWDRFDATVDAAFGTAWEPPVDDGSVLVALTGVSGVTPLTSELAIA